MIDAQEESHNSALFSSHNKAPPSPGIKSVVPPERSTRLDSNSHTQGKDLFGPGRTSSCHETCHDSPYSISCRADLLVRLPKIPVPLPGQPRIRHKMQLANLWQGSCFLPFHTIFI